MRLPIRGLRDSRDHFTKNILITGAANGIGRALATHYAHNGISLALFDKDRANLQTVVDEGTKLGAVAAMFVVDVTNRTEMDQSIFYYTENCGTLCNII